MGLNPSSVYTISKPCNIHGTEYPTGSPTLCVCSNADRKAKGHTTIVILWTDGQCGEHYLRDKDISDIFLPLEKFGQTV